MRRLLTIAAGLAAAVAAVLIPSWHLAAQGSNNGRFDVIFDDARGLIGGQLVKIAGAKAGTILGVVVTPNFKARVEASIDSRFLPFHTDATCTIRPEGLIAENYVDCDPGTVNAPELKASGNEPPTVPVNRTTEPVSLLDLFNIFNLPTRQRFSAIIDTLGIGTAGRGDDFNSVLRRANPALAQARQLISVLTAQNRALAGSIDATSQIASEASAHTAATQTFLDRAASLTSLTAAHKDNISLSIARLPPLLSVLQPSLAQLDTVAKDTTPLVEQLRAAAPTVSKVQSDLGPFTAAAVPGLADLGRALQKTIPAIKHSTPLVTTLNSYTARSLPGTKLFARLSSNLQRHGFSESFFNVVYSVATSLARHDNISHFLSILLIGPNNGVCSNYATTPVAGCSAHYGQQPAFTPTRSARDAGGTRPSTPTRGASPAATPGLPTASGPASAPSSPRRAGAGGAPVNTGRSASPAAPPPAPAAPSTHGASAPVSQSASTLQSLVNFLLK